MAIKLVVNGYFRSGTTFVWGYLRDSLPNYICFYEPLHYGLGTWIQREKRKKIKDPLIKELLWQEYINLGDEELVKFLRNHPSATKDGIYNESALVTYFNNLNKIPKPVLLQPNRLHFFLDTFKREYGAKIIHVIRHPLDVYNSILNVDKTMYLNGNKKGKLKYYSKKVLKTLYPNIRLHLGDFEVEKDYRWIRTHIGLPYQHEDNWSIKYFHRQSYFEKYVIVWTITNYYALKTIKNEQGYLLVYEELVKYPQKVTKDLEAYLDLKIKNKPSVMKNNAFKFEKSQLKGLAQVIEKYGLQEEFNYIIATVAKRKINYL